MALAQKVRSLPKPLGDDDRAEPALTRLRRDRVLGLDASKEEPVRRRAEWRQVVLSRARRARHELLTALENRDGRAGEEAAEHILKAKGAAMQRAWPWSWFEGSAQEHAWLSPHEADVEILELVPTSSCPRTRMMCWRRPAGCCAATGASCASRIF